MSLFRSEPVIRCQLILQSEAAYQCVAELGELKAVQFLDANPELSAFQRKFVSEIKRCEDLERILRFINKEALSEDITIRVPLSDPKAPNPRATAMYQASPCLRLNAIAWMCLHKQSECNGKGFVGSKKGIIILHIQRRRLNFQSRKIRSCN